MIRSLIVKLLWYLKLPQIIEPELSGAKIALCQSKVNGNGCVFYEEAKVVNIQNEPSKIVIGKDTHIRGELLVFGYGGEIEIGEYCYIGEGTRIWSGDNILIGNNVLISHNVNILDTNSHEINHLERAEGFKQLITKGHPSKKGNILTAPVTINDHAWISFGATVLKGVIVGEGAIVAAGSVVTKDVPSWTIVAGNPACVVREIPENER